VLHHFICLPFCQIAFFQTCHFVYFSCGLYYKHMTIINDDSSVVSEQSLKLVDDGRVIIYDRHMFIIQTTVCLLTISPSHHFANLKSNKLAMLSALHFSNLPFQQIVSAISSTYHVMNLPFYQLAILPTCHFATFPFCQLAIL
jgi:hypothetical protein